MPSSSLYCKAYPIDRFREFPAWRDPPPASPAPEKDTQEAPPSYLFLHADFTVTHDIFSDTDVVFDAVTDAWKAFCADVLEFRVPAYLVERDLAPPDQEGADGAAHP